MKGRPWVFNSACLAIFAVGACLSLAAPSYAKAPSSQYAQCAKVCKSCQGACQACERHCAAMVTAGMKEHVLSERLCQDSADICALTAKLCDRKSPMAPAECEACAKSCAMCAAECGKYKNMPIMVACAKSCKSCAAACNQMASSP